MSSSRSSAVGAPLRLMSLVLVLLLPVAWTGTAVGQGTSGQLPDPISTQDLSVFLERYVSPTGDQWSVIEGFHDAYKVEFERLREGEMEQFLKESRAMQGGVPSKAQIEKFVEKMDRITSRVRTLDNRLFDQVQTVLTDPQVARMPRVRLARERSIYTGSMMARSMAGAGRIVDLGDIVAALELTPEEKASIDLPMSQYEIKLTRASRDMHDATLSMFSDLVGALEEAGFADMDQSEMMSDPKQAQALMQTLRDAYAEVGRKVREAVAEIAKVNRRGLADAMAVLPEDPARRLRTRYLLDAYPEVARPVEGEMLAKALRAGSRMETLGADQQQAVSTLLANYLAEDDRLCDQAIASVDEQRRTRSPFDFDAESARERQEALEAIRRKRLDRAVEVQSQARSMLGDETFESLMSPQAQNEAVAEIAPVEVDEVEAAEQPRFDRFLPPPVGPRELADWNRRLGVDDSTRTIVESLHSDYTSGWTAEVTPRLEEVQKAAVEMYRTGDDGQLVSASAESVDVVFAKRKEALAAIDRLDQALIDDIRSVTGRAEDDEIIRLIRLRREMRRLSPGMQMYSPFQTGHEKDINLFVAIDDSLEDGDKALVETLVLEQADALQRSTRALFEVELDGQKELERTSLRMAMNRRAAADDEDGETGLMASGMEYQRVLQSINAKTAAVAEERLRILRDVRDTAIGALGEAPAKAFRRAYNAQAQPGVYDDERSAEPMLRKARRLGSLSDGQRTALESLSSEYVDGWESLSEQMAAVMSEAVATPGMDAEGWKQWQERQERKERLRFQRDELGVRTVRRLRDLLDESQLDQVAGINRYLEAPVRDDNPFD